jgi:hypothetical protein
VLPRASCLNASKDEPATLSLRRKKVVVKEEEPRKKSCQGRRDYDFDSGIRNFDSQD